MASLLSHSKFLGAADVTTDFAEPTKKLAKSLEELEKREGESSTTPRRPLR